MLINQEILNKIIKEELTKTASNVWDRIVEELKLNKADVCLETNNIDNNISLLFGDNKLMFSIKQDYVKHYITEGNIIIKDSQKGETTEYTLDGVIIKGGQIISAKNPINFAAYLNADGVVVEKVEVKETEFKKIEISIEDFGKEWEHKIKVEV